MSPSTKAWQNAHVERVIGSPRECLDHVIFFNERHLRRVLSSYVDYYHRTRTHLSLGKDCPDSRPIRPPRIGRVVAISHVGSLHHRYERLAALLVRAPADRWLPCSRLRCHLRISVAEGVRSRFSANRFEVQIAA
jgi:hypothetical protein